MKKDIFCKAFPANFPEDDDCYFYNQDTNNPCCTKFYERTAIGEIPVSCFVLNKHLDCKYFVALSDMNKYSEWLENKTEKSFLQVAIETSRMMRGIRKYQHLKEDVEKYIEDKIKELKK